MAKGFRSISRNMESFLVESGANPYRVYHKPMTVGSSWLKESELVIGCSNSPQHDFVWHTRRKYQSYIEKKNSTNIKLLFLLTFVRHYHKMFLFHEGIKQKRMFQFWSREDFTGLNWNTTYWTIFFFYFLLQNVSVLTLPSGLCWIEYI